MNQNMSIYIPKVFANTKEEDFKFMFEVWSIGKVNHVDIIVDSTGNSNNQAYVHLDYWYDTIANQELQKRLNNEESVRKYYIIPKSLKDSSSVEKVDESIDSPTHATANRSSSTLRSCENVNPEEDNEEEYDDEGYYENEEYDDEEYDENEEQPAIQSSFFWVFLKNKSKKQVPGERKITIDLTELTFEKNSSVNVSKVVPTISYAHYDYYTQIVKVNENYKEEIRKLIYDNIYASYFPSEMYYENLSEYYVKILTSTDQNDPSFQFAMQYKNHLDFTYGLFLQAFNKKVNSILTNEYIITKPSDLVIFTENLVDNSIILEIEKENYYLYNSVTELRSLYKTTLSETACDNLFL